MAAAERQVWFKLTGLAENLGFVGRDGTTLEVELDDGVTLHIGPNPDRPGSSDSRITVYGLSVVSRDAASALRRRVAFLDSASESLRGLPQQEIEWILGSTPAVQNACDAAAEALTAYAYRFVRRLRWMANRMGNASPLTNVTLDWALEADAHTWYSRPPRQAIEPQFGGDDGEVQEIDPGAIPILRDLIQAEGVVEPLGRDMLIEAGALSASSPRAAWVMAVAAAEVGIKEFAATQAQAESSEAWLLMELQSPPLQKLISDYLPLATPEKKRWTTEGAPIPKLLRTALTDGVKRRNEFVHRGGLSPTAEEVVALLEAVNDFLYLLDWHAGHDWARNHLRDETRALVPEPSEYDSQ